MPRKNTPPAIIAPSILAADMARLGEEVTHALAAGADWAHVDVMDNHYVPNLTFGPWVCVALRKFGIAAPLDVHLMVKPVDRIIGEFAEAGATHITIHPESTEHLHRSLSLIRAAGCKAGVAFNPGTPLHSLTEVMELVDLVLIMSVNPGFGGQKFIPTALNKIKRAREMINTAAPTDAGGVAREIRIAVDGGIGADNIAAVKAAGADTFIAGSAIFGAPDANSPNKYDRVIAQLRAALV